MTISAFGRILLTGFRCSTLRNANSECIKVVSTSSFLRPELFSLSKSFATANKNAPKVKMQSHTPYIIFVTEKMPDLRVANPGIRVPDLGRMLGQMWRLLSEKEKEVYRTKYREQRIVFEAERQSQLDKLSKAEKEQLKLDAQESRRRRKLRRRKRLLKILEKPKPVDVNPYVLFVKSRALERGDAPFQQYVRGLADFWKKMPEEDKQPYVDQARVNSVKYRLKLAEWEKKMLAQGRDDLVRLSALRRRRRRARAAKTTRRMSARETGRKKRAAKPRAPRKRTVSTQTENTTKKSAKKTEE